MYVNLYFIFYILYFIFIKKKEFILNHQYIIKKI